MNEVADDPIFALVAAANPIAKPDAAEPLDREALQLLDSITTRTRAKRPSSDKRSRRKAAAFGASVVAVIGVSSAAAATGLVPSGVIHAFTEVSPAGDTVQDANMVVEQVSSNGRRDQLWLGRNSSGMTCGYQRNLPSDGSNEDGMKECGGPWLFGTKGKSVVGTFVPAGDAQTPGTYAIDAHSANRAITRIILNFGTAGDIPLTLNPTTGWAIGVVPADLTWDASILTAYDTDGNVVATQTMTPTAGPASVFSLAG
jgi:hypothetical protein